MSGRCDPGSIDGPMGFFAGVARIGVDPVRDADLVFSLCHRFAGFVVAVGVVFHVLYGFQQAWEGTVFLAALGVGPVETVGALDDASVVVVGRGFGYGVFHDASSVP